MRSKLMVIALFVLCTALHAAENPEDQFGFIPDISSDKEMKIAPASPSPFIFSYGGWIIPSVISEDTSRGSLTSSVNMAKLWVRMTLGDGSYVYVRGKDLYSRVVSKYDGKKSNNSIDLDSAYVEGAFLNQAFVVDAGRRYFIVGSGIVLNDRGDGMNLSFNNRFVNLSFFGMYTGFLKKADNPYNLSTTDATDGAKRIFTGIALDKSFLNQTAYLFSVIQIDTAKESGGSKTRYQSQYYGGGLKGVPADGLDYRIEGIYETGNSYTDPAGGTVAKEKIQAFAAYASVNYFFNLPFKPAFDIQYAVASGDKDRTSTGSTGNFKSSDKEFTGFGGIPLGVAFRPTLSNIQVIRAGLSFKPTSWVSSERLNRMFLGAKYSYYLKSQSASQVSDSIITNNNRNLGQALDLNYRWEIFSDLSFFAQYGIFFPGKAYPSSEKNRTILIAGSLFEF